MFYQCILTDVSMLMC